MTDRGERRGGMRGRLMGLGVLVGLVAIAMAYFGNCIPGFGTGGSSAPASSTTQPAAEHPKGEATTDGLRVVVDGDRCKRGDEAPTACDALCRALATEPKTQRVEIDGTVGMHAAVDGLRKCLAEQGFRDVVVRAE